MKTLSKRLITDFHESASKRIIPRDYAIPVNSRKIISLREINALQEAMRYFKLSEAILITQDDEEIMKIDGQTVVIKPLWKWLLQ